MRSRPALLLILILAAGLRFWGLAAGIRHLPQQFERIFVQSVSEMVSKGDFNQRSFLYPGLFFYLLYLPIAFVHSGGPSAYLAARRVVASFGVLNVGLTYVLGSRVSGRRVGLIAALVMAVSPLEVKICHAIHPDIVLETFALLALLAFRTVGPGLKGDLRSGVALGAATAVKFTGVLLVPSYLAYRFLAAGPRVARIALAGVVSVVTFFVFTPYAIVAPRAFVGGMHEQLTYQYVQHAEAPTHLRLALFYVRTAVAHLGVPGACLFVLGLLAWRKGWREWGPLLLLPFVAVAVYSTATIAGARFLVPACGVLALLAARGAVWVVDRLPRAGWLLVVLTALPPLGESLDFALKIARPTPLDQASEWIGAHLPPGSAVLTGEKHLVIDKTRFDLVWADVSNAWSNRLIARNIALVVADPADPMVKDFIEVYRAVSATPEAGPTLGLFVAPPGLRPVYRPVPLQATRLSSSENEALLGTLRDGNRFTFWHSSSWQGPETWIQVEWPAPILLGRVVTQLRNHIGSSLTLFVTEDGQSWRAVPTAEVESTNEEGPPRQTLLLEPTRVRGIRIVPARKFHTRWAVTELRLDEVLDE
jgi:hypothetical protein